MSNFFERARTLDLSDTDEVSKHDWLTVATAHASFKPREFKVAVALFGFANKNLWAWPTRETLAERCGFTSVTVVSEATQGLLRKQAIEIHTIKDLTGDDTPSIIKRQAKGNAYRLSASWAIREGSQLPRVGPKMDEPEHLKKGKEARKRRKDGTEKQYAYGTEKQYEESHQKQYAYILREQSENNQGELKSQATGSISDPSTHPGETSIGKSGGGESGIQIQLYVEIRKRLGSVA
ncbi:MAG: hypothetical protein RLN82_01525, partial [Pseudomonadales bacterium]